MITNVHNEIPYATRDSTSFYLYQDLKVLGSNKNILEYLLNVISTDYTELTRAIATASSLYCKKRYVVVRVNLLGAGCIGSSIIPYGLVIDDFKRPINIEYT